MRKPNRAGKFRLPVIAAALFAAAAVLFVTCDQGGGETEPEVTKYNVHFYTDGENFFTVPVKEGDPVERPDDPVRPGYVFIDWYAGLTEVYDFSTPVTADKDLYARWEEEDDNSPTKTVRFLVYSGVYLDNVIVDTGTPVGRPEDDPERDGYIFLGWYTSQTAAGVPYDFSAAVTGNITIYARWQNKPRSRIDFRGPDGVAGLPEEPAFVMEGTAAGKPETDPVLAGQRFIGWYKLLGMIGEEDEDGVVIEAKHVGDSRPGQKYGDFIIEYTAYSFKSLVTEDATLVARFNTGNGNTALNTVTLTAVTDPATGNYPQGHFLSTNNNIMRTYIWEPAIDRVFEAGTEYTLTIILEPSNKGTGSVKNLTLAGITNLPSGGAVQSVESEHNGENFIVTVKYNATDAAKAPREKLFEDLFSGTTLNSVWTRSNSANRHNMSSWRQDMVEVMNGQLNIWMKRDPTDAPATTQNNDNPLTPTVPYPEAWAQNWIRTGAVNGGYNRSYGYWEAKIRVPGGYSGRIPWGAFWMGGNSGADSDDNFIRSARRGTEIDIMESIDGDTGSGGPAWNSALHWNGYNYDIPNGHKSVSLGSHGSANGNVPGAQNLPEPLPHINVYDGEFHVFAFDWGPSGYKFMVDGELFWHVYEGYKDFWDNQFRTVGIDQNPHSMIISVEAAPWLNNPEGTLPQAWIDKLDNGDGRDAMEIEWVRVWNQPPE